MFISRMSQHPTARSLASNPLPTTLSAPSSLSGTLFQVDQTLLCEVDQNTEHQTPKHQTPNIKGNCLSLKLHRCFRGTKAHSATFITQHNFEHSE